MLALQYFPEILSRELLRTEATTSLHTECSKIEQMVMLK